MSLKESEDREEVVNPIFNTPVEELLEPVSKSDVKTMDSEMYDFGKEATEFVYEIVKDELGRDILRGEAYAMFEEMNRGTAPATIAEEIGRYQK